MSERKDLEITLASQIPLLTVTTHEELRAVQMIRAILARGDASLSQWSVTDGIKSLCGDPLVSADNLRLQGEHHVTDSRTSADPEAALRTIRNSGQSGYIIMLDFHPFLSEPVHVRLIKEIAQEYSTRGQKLIFISHDITLPSELSRFSAQFELSLPSTVEIGRIVAEEAEIWATRNPGKRVQADKRAVTALVNNLSGLTRTDARQLVRNAIYDDGTISESDVNTTAEAKRSLIGQDGLLSFEFDTAHLSDVGGLASLKAWLNRRQGQLTAAKGDDRPRGIMLLGVQGGGKSLAAKAVAGIWKLPLLRLDFGVLYNKFFGETERNMREALKTAEIMAPCVLWCDEIEKGISTGDYDSGTSKRLLGTMLTWMAENDRPVFIVATANDISALPPELMRKGRLDEIFFVDLPSPSSRADIFSIHLAKRRLDPTQFDLASLAKSSDGFTGAEIEQAIVSARYATDNDSDGPTTQDILEAINATRPLSVVMAEDIARLRQWADDRTVPAE